MDKDFQVFDFHRIFIGDGPVMFLLEIVFRTIVMYVFTFILLRILGKRGMGQLSTLELAIIISFGSAVGDPMVGADMPIFHGMVAISVITLLQIGLEHLANKNINVEKIVDGTPQLVVDDGLIKRDCLAKENMSREDLFRALRGKDVEQLGQVSKAFFETSGQLSAFFHPPKKIRAGLSILPDEGNLKILDSDLQVWADDGMYSCMNCGYTQHFSLSENVRPCNVCGGGKWQQSVK